MGEVVQAPVPVEAEIPQEVAGHTSPRTAASEPPAEESGASPEVANAKMAPVPEPKPKEETILAFPAPSKESEGEEPRGLWGGFWRRHTND
jgi:hypothetical protein